MTDHLEHIKTAHELERLTGSRPRRILTEAETKRRLDEWEMAQRILERNRRICPTCGRLR